MITNRPLSIWVMVSLSYGTFGDDENLDDSERGVMSRATRVISYGKQTCTYMPRLAILIEWSNVYKLLPNKSFSVAHGFLQYIGDAFMCQDLLNRHAPPARARNGYPLSRSYLNSQTTDIQSVE